MLLFWLGLFSFRLFIPVVDLFNIRELFLADLHALLLALLDGFLFAASRRDEQVFVHILGGLPALLNCGLNVLFLDLFGVVDELILVIVLLNMRIGVLIGCFCILFVIFFLSDFVAAWLGSFKFQH